MITIVIMYAVLASTFTVAKMAIQYATPYFLIGFRMICAGSIFLLIQYIFSKDKFFVRREDLFLFLKTSFFYIYLAYMAEFWSLQYLTSSKVVIIFSLTPFIAATFAYFFASERLTLKKVFGMIIGSIGIIPLLLTQDDIREAATELFNVSLPELVLLIAVFSGAYGWFPVKRLMNKGYSLPMINGVTMLIGGIAAMGTSFLVEGFNTIHVFSVGPFLFWTLLLVILANGIFYTMYGWHLRKFSFTMLSFAGFLTPLFGALFGWYFLNEPITWHHLAALCLIGSGLYVFYKDEFSKLVGK